MHKKDPESGEHTIGGDDAFVIGTQMAKATEAERRRVEGGTHKKSPMPEGCYRPNPKELGLVRAAVQDYDKSLRIFAEEFANGSPQERDAMRSEISMDELYILRTFGSRAAVFGLRERDLGWMQDGFSALAMIELERIDWRDAFTPLSLLYHAASRIQADPDKLCQHGITIAEPKMAKLIQG
jgi:hypothetical protein